MAQELLSTLDREGDALELELLFPRRSTAPRPAAARTRPLIPRPPVPSYAPRVLTYSPRDVIERRISVPAQHALVRLSKNPATRVQAISMLGEVKAGRIAGIYKADERPPAQRAQSLHKSLGWGSLIPKGEPIALNLDPQNLFRGQPIIVFHPSLAPVAKGAALDSALIRGWQAYVTFRSESRSGALCCNNLANPEVLDRFDFDKDTVQPFHQPQIARVAGCVDLTAM